ncbi:sensor histidine kinase [Agrobacterium larrymoorei]|uniref:histidine kinase n=1 Tax=Agrobacterium larrymoorei TaxID=160699 RepID=A0ABU0UH66_9HYPH|nr:sensor histidine kinase [Agrobacterium larrymoorei]MDQ1184287.1 two-component sensor histidine kinase [Agrobacterium larrymoorei]
MTISRFRAFFARLSPTASIGTYIVIMTTLVTLPLIIFAGYLMLRLEADEREDLQREAVDDARAISRNIERRLQELSTTLNLLAQFPELEDGDLASFHQRVSESLRRRNIYVVVATRDGVQKVNTRVPYGQPLGQVPADAHIKEAIDAKRIMLSNIFYANNRKEWVFTVTLPLPRQLAAAGDVLIVTQAARDLSSLISTDAIPAGWSATLLDSGERVVISSNMEQATPGKIYEPAQLAADMSAFSGSFTDTHNNIYAYAQLPGWPWKAVVAGAIDRSDSALRSTWRQMLIGSLFIVLVAVFGTYLVGRQLRQSVKQLVDVAERIGAGEIVSRVETNVKELNQVGVALSNASFDRSQAEDRNQLILHELVHRSKNMLTLVQAMMRQLARENTTVPELQKEVDHRLRGLAMSISALAEVQWDGLPIHRLVKGHLEVFGSTADQVTVSGEDFLLSPEAAQNLGLILHELSTNSIKYGALSVKEGRVRLHWALDPSDHDMVKMEWIENGGPPASQPSRRGFGSTIIKRHAESAFSATVSTDYAETGFTWTMTAPVKRLQKRNTGTDTA